jgi:hypothetical protein
MSHLEAVAGVRMAEVARRYWYVLKTCIAMMYPPEEFCLMDDDVFILDHCRDALEAFRTAELVYAPDTDHSNIYLRTWGFLHGRRDGLRTGRFNAGLYWMRNPFEPRKLAQEALKVPLRSTPAYVWEQGFIANLFAHRAVRQLPTQRYFYPLFDGLPGGMMGYDYGGNPCGFASIHYGGLSEKPNDAASLMLAKEILERATGGRR